MEPCEINKHFSRISGQKIIIEIRTGSRYSYIFKIFLRFQEETNANDYFFQKLEYAIMAIINSGTWNSVS